MKRFELGQSASVSRAFDERDLAEYRVLTGDNGLHCAAASENAVPGPLLGGMLSQLLGTVLPGYGTNWLKQSLRFVRPAPLGEVITARVTVTRVRPEKALVNLHTRCEDADGNTLCEGEALVLVRDVS
jgi:3-hydroxybutyryl-CoA dehydratase